MIWGSQPLLLEQPSMASGRRNLNWYSVKGVVCICIRGQTWGFSYLFCMFLFMTKSLYAGRFGHLKCRQSCDQSGNRGSKIKKMSPTVPKEHTVDKGVVTIAPVLASRCDPFKYSSTCCVFLNVFMGCWLKIIDPTKWYKMHDCNWLFHISWPKMRSLCPNPQFLAMAISQKLPKIFSRRPSHDVALPRRRCEIPAWVLSQPARWQCPPKILSLDDSILAASKLRWQVRHLNHRFWDFVLNIPYLWEKYKLTCLGPFFRFPYQAGRPTADLTRIKQKS